MDVICRIFQQVKIDGKWIRPTQYKYVAMPFEKAQPGIRFGKMRKVRDQKGIREFIKKNNIKVYRPYKKKTESTQIEQKTVQSKPKRTYKRRKSYAKE